MRAWSLLCPQSSIAVLETLGCLTQKVMVGCGCEGLEPGRCHCPSKLKGIVERRWEAKFETQGEGQRWGRGRQRRRLGGLKGSRRRNGVGLDKEGSRENNISWSLVQR